MVLTLCAEGKERCEGLGGGAAGLRAGQWPQARLLPRDPWPLLLPEVQWAGVRPPPSWGLACRQAVTGAPESTPPFSPTLSQGTDLCRGPSDTPVSGLLAGCGWWTALWRMGGVRVSSGCHRWLGPWPLHILSPGSGLPAFPSSRGCLCQCLQLCHGPGGTLAVHLLVVSIYAKCSGTVLMTIARTAYGEKD